MASLNVVTARGVSEALGIPLYGVDYLRRAGELPEPERVGRQYLYPRDKVDALAARTTIEPPYPAAYVVRVAAKTAVDGDPERRWMGYSKGPYDDDTTKERDRHTRADALRGWWPVKNPEQYVGLPLVAVLATFVVQTYEILPGGTARNGRFRFEVDPLDATRSAPFDGHRLRLDRGPLSLPIGTR